MTAHNLNRPDYTSAAAEVAAARDADPQLPVAPGVGGAGITLGVLGALFLVIGTFVTLSANGLQVVVALFGVSLMIIGGIALVALLALLSIRNMRNQADKPEPRDF